MTHICMNGEEVHKGGHMTHTCMNGEEVHKGDHMTHTCMNGEEVHKGSHMTTLRMQWIHTGEIVLIIFNITIFLIGDPSIPHAASGASVGNMPSICC